MNKRAYVAGLYEYNAGRSLLDALGRVYPEGRVKHYFKAMVPVEDPRLFKILATLNEAGWVPWLNHDRERIVEREFVLCVHRDFLTTELDGLSHLQLLASDYLFSRDIHGEVVYDHCGSGRDDGTPRGRLILEPKFLRQDVDFACTMRFGEWPVVPDRVRRVLVGDDLRGLVFRETALRSYPDDATQIMDRVRRRKILTWEKLNQPPWWELASSITLPPAVPPPAWPADKVVSASDIIAGRDLPYVLYARPEMTFRASDLCSVDDFDLAEVPESFGKQHRETERPLVASQRFRQVCLEHGLKVEWVPVHVHTS